MWVSGGRWRVENRLSRGGGGGALQKPRWPELAASGHQRCGIKGQGKEPLDGLVAKLGYQQLQVNKMGCGKTMLQQLSLNRFVGEKARGWGRRAFL